VLGYARAPRHDRDRHPRGHDRQAHRGRRGTGALNALVSRYRRLDLHRCKSDAEAYALHVLDEHKRPLPQVNEPIDNLEADLS